MIKFRVHVKENNETSVVDCELESFVIDKNRVFVIIKKPDKIEMLEVEYNEATKILPLLLKF